MKLSIRVSGSPNELRDLLERIAVGLMAASGNTMEEVTYTEGPVAPDAPREDASPNSPQEDEQPDYSYRGDTDALPLLPVSEERRVAARAAFKDLVEAWLENYKEPGKPQPDRLEMLKRFGQSRHAYPLLVEAYSVGSLQELIRLGAPEDASDDFIFELAGNMVQCSHAAMPDLSGTIDYSNRWRKDYNS